MDNLLPVIAIGIGASLVGGLAWNGLNRWLRIVAERRARQRLFKLHPELEEGIAARLPKEYQDEEGLHEVEVLSQAELEPKSLLRTAIRSELAADRRASFWPNLLQSFLMNLLFFVLGVAAALLIGQPH
jgi:hypothetical protein